MIIDQGIAKVIPWKFPSAYFSLGKQISFGTLCSLYVLDLYLNTQVNLSE